MKLQGFFISNQISKQSFALVLFLFLSLPLYATNWYVDGAVNSSGNGQSWATAWKAFSNINWSSIQPGDFIFISGGTDSKVYTSGLSVGKSGTPGNLITITGSYEANHNGKVIIQGSGWSGTGVSCVGDSYIRIANVHIRLWYVGINGGNSNVLYWDSVYVNKCQWAASPCTQGSGSDSVFIRWSRIVSDSTTATQTDALSCTNVTNLEVSNCYIYQGNRYASSGHSDIMQVRQSGRQLYYNNWFEEEGSELDSSAAAGLNGQINYAGDSTLFYNNVMIKRGWSYNTYMDQGNTGHVWMMYNNTFINEYTYGQGGVYQTQQIYSFAKNNIFMSLSNYGSMMIGTLSPGRSNFDYNQYYSPNASGIFGSNNPASFSSWQSQGGDINGAAGNPLFTDRENLDLTLQGGSPCINAGTAEIKAYIESYKYSGGYLPWADYNGSPRSETAPSIGAYEYLGVNTVDPVNNGLPKEFSLYQNYPNPFNPATIIRYSIPIEGLVTLKVYNTIGEEVITLANELKQEGNYEVEFDASDLSSGIYFYKLQTSDFSQVKKMILLK
jgi:hypothetical protein